jgi:hypothetical protein
MKKAYGDFKYSGNTEELMARIIADKDQYEKLRSRIQAAIISEGGTPDEVAFWVFEEVALRAWEYNAKIGICDHYFFTGDNFHEWLKNTSCPISCEQSEIVKEFFSKTMGDINTLSDARPIMFHFKPGNQPAILLGMRRDTPDRYHVSAIDGHMQAFFYVPDDERIFHTKHGELVLGLRNLVSSAIAYISCFPETVVAGIPEDLKHPNHFRKTKCYSVGVSPKVAAVGTHDSPCPHYRTGHWRHLKSEKFKKKRGQTIFIAGVFVKGKATTVLSPEDADSHTQNPNFQAGGTL